MKAPAQLASPPSTARLAPSDAKIRFEASMVEIFGELADLFGNPRSHGQIYGVLFTSEEPLLMEDIAKRTGISLGSASNGLRALEELEIVERKASGRIGYYTARLELKTLINGFIRHRLVPRLKKSNARLKKMGDLLSEMNPSEAGEAGWRLQRVAQWHARAEQFLPLAEKILGSKFLQSRASSVEKK